MPQPLLSPATRPVPPCRQSNWKLDPPLRKACKTDVLMNCNAEDAQNSEEGLVYKCMIGKYELLTAGCQKELGRAVHMAFFAWQRGAILTAECDDDIEKLCLIARPNMGTRPGAVGTCLAQLVGCVPQAPSVAEGWARECARLACRLRGTVMDARNQGRTAAPTSPAPTIVMHCWSTSDAQAGFSVLLAARPRRRRVAMLCST